MFGNVKFIGEERSYPSKLHDALALKMSPYCKYNACPLFAERTLNRFLFISITETIIKQQLCNYRLSIILSVFFV